MDKNKLDLKIKSDLLMLMSGKLSILANILLKMKET